MLSNRRHLQLILSALGLSMTFGCSATDTAESADNDAGDAASDTSTAPETAAETGADAEADTGIDAPVSGLIATIVTSKGTIRVLLNDAASPVTVDNFQKYADAKFYDGLLFHRVIPDFMIQGGGMEPGMTERSPLFPAIVNEAATSGLSNLRGTIAMARTSAPNSATSQFFINSVDNTFLDPGGSDPNGYAAFGNVIDGIDVVDAISAVPTHTVGSYEDVPVDDLLIQSLAVELK